MARPKKVPKPISQETDTIIQRYLPRYQNPDWATAQAWRKFVKAQPIMVALRDALIYQLISLPWQVQARDPERTDELRDEIDYYQMDILGKWNGEDFDVGVDLLLQDMLTLPFGGAIEIGYFRDGTVAWIRSLDAANLFPTGNPDWPVAQRIPEASTEAVLFPKETVARAYVSPKTEFRQRGWGVAPPEKIYLSAVMLSYGDNYYYQFFVDTPEAGILDLADFDESSAKAWVKAFRSLLSGVDPYKIGVTYEHEKPVQFIPFNRSPHDVQFSEGRIWYAHLCSSGYGIPLSWIGITEKQTMAGEIRADRRNRRTGFGYAVAKVKNVIDRVLPDYLEFTYEDQDNEELALKGRALTVASTAYDKLIGNGTITAEQAFAQLIADGLLKNEVVGSFKGVDGESSTRTNEQNDERKVPPDEGGLSEVKDLTEQSLTALWPLKGIITAHSEADVLELGDQLIMKYLGDIDEESEGELAQFVKKSRDSVQSEKGNVALLSAVELMTTPWARRSLERASYPHQLKGTTLYSKLFHTLEGVA